MANEQSLQLSATELRAMTKWQDPVVLRFLSLIDFITNLFGTAHTWTAKQTFAGFTVLGDASVKVKKLTGTTGAMAGDNVTVAHGVALDKIISVTGGVNDGSALFLPCSPVAADEFSFVADATDINVTNGASATNILSQPFVITIIYEE